MANPIQVGLRDLLAPFFITFFANPAALDWMYAYKVDWDEEFVDELPAVIERLAK